MSLTGQASANIQGLTDKLDMLIAKLGQLGGAAGGAKARAGGGGTPFGPGLSSQQFWESGNQGDKYYGPGFGPGGMHGYANHADSLTMSGFPGAEASSGVGLSWRKQLAFASQLNALSSIIAQKAFGTDPVAQNIQAGVSNALSTISVVHMASVLAGTAGMGPGGLALFGLGIIVQALNWSDFIVRVANAPSRSYKRYNHWEFVDGEVQFRE